MKKTHSIDVLKVIYKPIKYTIKGKTTILNTMNGDFVVKEKKGDVRTLYNYLYSRNFDYFPPLIDDSRSEVNVYKYVNDTPMPTEQKATDIIDIITLLHNKTTYYKEVTIDQYKAIYENIENNIIYSKNHYNGYYNILSEKEIPSPSEYLLLRNVSKILSALDFASDELESWFDIVKDEKKERVSVVHNNLELNHYIKDDKEYLISWEQAKIDSPIVDLINFYKKDYLQLNFEEIIKRYLQKYPLLDSEKKLLFIVLSIPPLINLTGNEFNDCKNMRYKLDYLYKTESLIRPYYAVEQEEQENDFY